VVSDGTKIFHVAGCDYIHNKDKVRTITAKEAIQQGYTPCLRCLRKYVDTTATVGRTALGSEADARDADSEDEKQEGGQ
jgi:methylphosphotriester-DNA--protein-cysteine methyltransferase